jgi:hypothetical protein
MDTTQLDRMASFGSDKVDVNTGQVELGLNRNEIQKFITANVLQIFLVQYHLHFVKCLQNKNILFLLQVMGKPGKDGERYFSMQELDRSETPLQVG